MSTYLKMARLSRLISTIVSNVALVSRFVRKKPSSTALVPQMSINIIEKFNKKDLDVSNPSTLGFRSIEVVDQNASKWNFIMEYREIGGSHR